LKRVSNTTLSFLLSALIIAAPTASITGSLMSALTWNRRPEDMRIWVAHYEMKATSPSVCTSLASPKSNPCTTSQATSWPSKKSTDTESNAVSIWVRHGSHIAVHGQDNKTMYCRLLVCTREMDHRTSLSIRSISSTK
jgi:1,2-phenylacetyl-CoA epoxidase PaaB subunit